MNNQKQLTDLQDRLNVLENWVLPHIKKCQKEREVRLQKKLVAPIEIALRIKCILDKYRG